MKRFYAILLLLCHIFILRVAGQSYIKTLNPTTWIHSQQSNSDDLFNFNSYHKYLNQDTIFQVSTQNNALSFYLVFNQEEGEQLARVVENDNSITLGKEYITTSRPIYTGTKYNKNYFINYSGPVSQLKKDLEYYQISLGNKEVIAKVAEALFIPKIINKINRNKLDTYFSIKYGISLPYENDYYSSKGTKLWDHKTPKLNRFEVTGLGIDKGSGLFQIKSRNDNDTDKVTFSLTETRQTTDNMDEAYMLWANNGENSSFKSSSKTKAEILQKNWHVQFSGDYFMERPISFEMLLSAENQDEYSYFLGVESGFRSDTDIKNAVIYPLHFDGNKIFTNSIQFNKNQGSKFSLFIIRVKKPVVGLANAVCHEDRFDFRLTISATLDFDYLLIKNDTLSLKCDSNEEIRGLSAGEYTVNIVRKEMVILTKPIKLDYSLCNKIEIFPNPVISGTKINITAQGLIEKDATIEVFSSKGEQLRILSLKEGLNQLNLVDFSPGMYIIKTINGLQVNEVKIAVVDNF